MNKERNFLIHPSYIAMFLLLAGISALFLGFSGAYLYNRIQSNVPPIELPGLFYWNTLFLMGSSLSLMKSQTYYKADNTSGYKNALGITLVLTIAFLIAQIYAWLQLQSQDIFVNYSTMASYLYIISILHFAHVFAGIPFLIWFILVSYKKMKTPVSVLIYFSDNAKKRKLNLLNWYWHFLDLLWIYLIVFFLLNYLFK
jgi:cytochrome c oxidase subunit 3